MSIMNKMKAAVEKWNKMSDDDKDKYEEMMLQKKKAYSFSLSRHQRSTPSSPKAPPAASAAIPKHAFAAEPVGASSAAGSSGDVGKKRQFPNQ